jgi:hypothetical protein
MTCDGLSFDPGVQPSNMEVYLGTTKKPPLTVVVGQVRDRLIQRLNGKKRFVVSHEEPHNSIRVEGYNSGVDDAIKIVMEEL